MFSFGKKVSPAEQARTWERQLKSEQRKMDREIRKLDREEMKMKNDIKREAKKGAAYQRAVRTMAKSLVRTRKTKERMYMTKAHLNSAVLQLKEQQASLRVARTMHTSTQVMQAMNQLVNIPQISRTAQAMAKEMEKAGLIQEMTDDAFDMVHDDQDEVEALADDEVNQVLAELTEGMFDGVEVPVTGRTTRRVVATEAAVEEDEKEEELDEMAARLAALGTS